MTNDKLFAPFTISPRHGFMVYKVPALYNMHIRPAMHYAQILDTAYEMADILANGNGISYDDALQQVIKDEKFSILAVHRKAIIDKLKA